MAPRFLAACVSTLALSTAPALADITPAEVWADWQDLTARYGFQTETAGIEEAGDTLTVRGVVLTMESEDAGSARVEAGDIVFRDMGDGRVSVELAPAMPFTMEFPDPEGGTGSISMTLGHTGAEMIVSGDTVDRVYDYSADTYGVSDVEIIDPSSDEDVEIALDLTLAAVSGRTTASGTDAIAYTSEVDAETLTVTATGSGTDDMGQPANFNLSAEARGFFERSNGTFTTLEPDDSPAEMIAKGFTADGRLGYAALAYALSGEGVDGPFQFTGTTERGEASFAMNEAGATYATETGPQTVNIMGGAPFPVSVSIGETGATLSMPLVPQEEPQDFALSLRLVDVALDEMIWNMLDPGAQITRDPASLVIDLSGEAIVTDDFLAPEFAETSEAPPGTIESLSLNELRLQIAGAALTGTGDFDFIQTGMMPQPVGQVDLMLKGGNALIETLVNMGILPQEQAMAGRMMLGLFTVPGEGEDEVTSTIEMREDGGVYANGQRVR